MCDMPSTWFTYQYQSCLQTIVNQPQTIDQECEVEPTRLEDDNRVEITKVFHDLWRFATSTNDSTMNITCTLSDNSIVAKDITISNEGEIPINPSCIYQIAGKVIKPSKRSNVGQTMENIADLKTDINTYLYQQHQDPKTSRTFVPASI